MSKEIICVYQDCPLCGDKGKITKKIITKHNLSLRKVTFASDEGKELIHKAVMEHNIGTMPFYTNGKNFSTNIEDFITKKVTSTKKTAKKNEKEGKNNELV